MTKRVLWMWMAGFLALGATPAMAAGGAHGKGAWEITLNSDLGDHHPVFVPKIGYYVIDNLALTVIASYAQGEEDDGTTTTDITQTTMGAGVEYNFPTGGSIIPVLGATLQYFNEEHDDGATTTEDSGTAIEVEGGVKFMVGERSSVNLLLAYLTGTLESSGSPDTDVTDLMLRVGYSIYFP
jgi:hypothetical protein